MGLALLGRDPGISGTSTVSPGTCPTISQSAGPSFARIEERAVRPDLVDVAKIHAFVLVKVDQLVIYLERVNLVEGFHIEPRSRHLPIVPGISYYVVTHELLLCGTL